LIVFALAASIALGLQASPPQQSRPQPAQRTLVRDSSSADTLRRRDGRRLGVTADFLRTAFIDAGARDLFLRARHARLTQDSTITSYTATGRERTTVRAGIGDHGIDRTVFRRESAFDVKWRAGVGAQVQLTGERVGIPVGNAGAQHQALEESVTSANVSPIPYFPGQEPLSLSGSARTEVNDLQLVEPLAIGAEAYYTYATGDSVSFTLPDGRRTRLRELKVRARRPVWNLVVGSFWFDEETGQVVRAAYRFAAPRDVVVSVEVRAGASSLGDALLSVLARSLVSPVRANVSGIVIEYGMFAGRFWLPRIRSVDASAHVSFARMNIVIEQAFSYPSINGPEVVARVVINDPTSSRADIPDSLSGKAEQRWLDSTRIIRRKLRLAFDDSLKRAPCDSTGTRVIGRQRGRDSSAVAVAVTYPCDVDKLAQSSVFTTPLFDANDALFGSADRDALIASALPFGAQAALALGALPRPSFQYGLSMTRYNRVEGVSTGVLVEQQLGAGYSATALGRLGWADREPNAEVSLARSNGVRTIGLAAYNRLVSANDWGHPLSFGSSVAALVSARDEGFYYRATGADLRWTTTTIARLEWRAFGEQERTAVQRTNYSFAGGFEPNVAAMRGGFAGLGMNWLGTTGADPRGVRTISSVRLETAAGTSAYSRGAFGFTVSDGLPGDIVSALTLSAGTSAGRVPAQRRWFLGGTQTIRGQSADTAQSGSAFWMSRAEIGRDLGGYRVATFGDIGWVGSRSAWTDGVRPLSGVGVGLSMLDGLIRFDLARGLYPRRQTKFAAYLDARF
jgi:hypothetical protein